VPSSRAVPQNIAAVIGLGGGSVMDAAKLRGCELGLEVLCVPTLLSTDAFLTSTAAIRRDGAVTYVPTGAPAVVIDDALLLRAPARLHALGCCDVLSMLTASRDWLLDGCADEAIIAEAALICDALMSAQDEVVSGSREGLHAVLRALEAEVALCARAGTDRVEEGSEHYFAYALERRLPGAMHGTLVGPGILAAALLQGQDVERLRRFMRATGIAATWRGVDAHVLADVVRGMAAFVGRHGYPRSVWNEVELTEYEALVLAEEVLA